MSDETNTPNPSQNQDPEYLANRDPLTSLLNRRGLDIELNGLIKQTPGEFSLVVVDLDGLKQINDGEGGHAAGDKLIKDAAEVLSSSLRTTESNVQDEHRDHIIPAPDIVTAARVGGDEFVLLLPGVNDQEVIESIIGRIKHNLSGKNISASMAGQLHKPGENGDDLIDAADKIMMARKEESKKSIFESLPRRKRIAAKIGLKALKYAGVNPPRQ